MKLEFRLPGFVASYLEQRRTARLQAAQVKRAESLGQTLKERMLPEFKVGEGGQDLDRNGSMRLGSIDYKNSRAASGKGTQHIRSRGGSQ